MTALDHSLHPGTAKREPDDRKTGPASFALDDDVKTAWTNERDPARNHDPAVLTFELAEPFQTGGTAHFKYTLTQRHGGFTSDDNMTYNLGRIRPLGRRDPAERPRPTPAARARSVAGRLRETYL